MPEFSWILIKIFHHHHDVYQLKMFNEIQIFSPSALQTKRDFHSTKLKFSFSTYMWEWVMITAIKYCKFYDFKFHVKSKFWLQLNNFDFSHSQPPLTALLKILINLFLPFKNEFEYFIKTLKEANLYESWMCNYDFTRFNSFYSVLWKLFVWISKTTLVWMYRKGEYDDDDGKGMKIIGWNDFYYCGSKECVRKSKRIAWRCVCVLIKLIIINDGFTPFFILMFHSSCIEIYALRTFYCFSFTGWLAYILLCLAL